MSNESTSTLSHTMPVSHHSRTNGMGYVSMNGKGSNQDQDPKTEVGMISEAKNLYQGKGDDWGVPTWVVE